MKTIEELTKIADLAKISLDGEDMAALLSNMGKYMAVADAVRDADLTGLDCAYERELAPPREDAVIPSYPVETLLSSADDSRDGHYVAYTGGRHAK